MDLKSFFNFFAISQIVNICIGALMFRLVNLGKLQICLSMNSNGPIHSGAQTTLQLFEILFRYR
jgi:hypothetical protein